MRARRTTDSSPTPPARRTVPGGASLRRCCLALLLPSAAHAGEPEPARYAPQANVCPASDLAKLSPPHGYRFVAGTASSRAKAWSAVKSEAKEQFAANGGLSRQEAVGRSVHPWCVRTDPRGIFKEYTYLALIPADVADAHELELGKLDEQWSELVASLADNVGGASLWIAPVVWRSGCASDLGAYVDATLRYQAGRRGLTALLATQPGKATATLRLELSLVGELVTVVPTLEDATGRRGLPGLQFAADLFHLESSPQDWCPTNERIALDGDRKDGSDGLRVLLDAPVSGGVACAGQRGAIAVTTSRPAAVRIYTLDRNGRGYVVYDTPFVNGRVDLGLVDLIPTDDGGDERLVAVAWPSNAAPTPTGGLCRLATPFSDVVFPEGIAVDTATWIVRPPGVEGCPEFDVAAVRGKLPERLCP